MCQFYLLVELLVWGIMHMVKRSTRKCTLALVSACLTVRSDCAVGIFCRVPSVYYLIIISGIGGRCLKLASVSYLAPPVNAA